MKNFSLVFILSLFVVGFMLVQRSITGSVKDSNGEPRIGANLLIKKSSTGTVTDIDGNFSLEVQEGIILEEAVVTSLGITREKKSLT